MEMLAVPVISLVLESLGNLLIEDGRLLSGQSDQIKEMQRELRRMQCFLRDADAKQDEGEMVRNWVLEITDIAYQTEDVIETYLLNVAVKGRYYCILNKCIPRYRVWSGIKDIKSKISELTRSLETYGLIARIEGTQQGPSSSSFGRLLQLRRSYSHIAEDDFVGLEKDVEKLVGLLVNEDADEKYRVVTICGMGGLGKTTLARKIYNNTNVKRYFEGFAWVCISQQWQKEDVLRNILIKFVQDENLRLRNDQELVRLLVEVLQKKKCLIVLDDIWSTDAWDDLKQALPIGTMGSKLLLTTRKKEVASHVDPNGFLHEQRFLDEEESWELFKKKAFTNADSTESKNNKIELGRQMVKHCGGLPLAVVVLGGLLVTKHSLREWEIVHENIISYLNRGKGNGGVSPMLALSYIDLPYQLKPCFLYLGSFMEDSEIAVEQLYQMWMAEGMICSHDRREEETMMDVAECYLMELAQRCMVQVNVDEYTGVFVSCRLHDMMRELCLLKGKEEYFFEVLDFRSQGIKENTSSSSLNRTQRVAIYLETEVGINGLPKLEMSQHLRSLVYSSISYSYTVRSYLKDSNGFLKLEMCQIPRSLVYSSNTLRSYLKDFKLLRVLHLEGIRFEVNTVLDSILGSCSVRRRCSSLPKAVGKLIHLRYLSIRHSSFRGLPSSIGNLQYIQTLDLRVGFEPLFIPPNVLSKMGRLMHLYLPRNILKGTKLGLNYNNLETLVNCYSTSFDMTTLLKFTSLRRLDAKVRSGKPEDLAAIIQCQSTSLKHLRQLSIYVGRAFRFCSEEELDILKQLLGCRHLNNLEIECVIGNLPEIHHFSCNLTRLMLSYSNLTEDPMATLENLPNLWNLQLLCDSFVGMEMICSTIGFPQLKCLVLWGLKNLEKWKVDEGAMRNLLYLRISSCQKLEGVPEGLRFVTTLQELSISFMPAAFEKRLRDVDGEEGEDFYKVRHVPSITIR